MTFQEWQKLSLAVHTRADRISRMIVKRARRVALAAGLDPRIPFLHAHNAMISHDCGKPWKEVDYSLCRKVLWLERKSWEPGRLASQILGRAWKQIDR